MGVPYSHISPEEGAKNESLLRRKLMYENAYIPTETYGWCEGKKCYENGYLADGLCVGCWDKQAENKITKTKKIKGVHIST